MSEQSVSPDRVASEPEDPQARGQGFWQRALVLARFGQMHNLPTPIAIRLERMEVQLNGEPMLADYRWWHSALGDPSIFVRAEQRWLHVSAVGELPDKGRVEIVAALHAEHIMPFPRRLASLPEVRGLLAPPPAPLAAESAPAEAVSR